MKLVALLALAITLLAEPRNTADRGPGIDPNGSTQSSDIGCGIDPNGCNDSRGAMDPNGRGSAIDPNG